MEDLNKIGNILFVVSTILLSIFVFSHWGIGNVLVMTPLNLLILGVIFLASVSEGWPIFFFFIYLLGLDAIAQWPAYNTLFQINIDNIIFLIYIVSSIAALVLKRLSGEGPIKPEELSEVDKPPLKSTMETPPPPSWNDMYHLEQVYDYSQDAVHPDIRWEWKPGNRQY